MRLVMRYYYYIYKALSVTYSSLKRSVANMHNKFPLLRRSVLKTQRNNQILVFRFSVSRLHEPFLLSTHILNLNYSLGEHFGKNHICDGRVE